MPIPLGILAVAGAGGGGLASSYDLLTTTVLGTAVNSVTFSNLNTNYGSTYKHLQLRYALRGTRNSSTDVLQLRLNGSTSTYPNHALQADGTGVFSFSSPSTSITLLSFPANTATANAFAVGVTDILDAFTTTKNKTIRDIGGRVLLDNNQVRLTSGLLISTSAIDSITLFANVENFAQNSRISLYGIR